MVAEKFDFNLIASHVLHSNTTVYDWYEWLLLGLNVDIAVIFLAVFTLTLNPDIYYTRIIFAKH